MAIRYPEGLADGGRSLWRAIITDHTLNAMQKVQLEEACRAKDRLDKMDRMIRGQGIHELLLDEYDGTDVKITVVVSSSFSSKANDTANLMKQLLAALRLPDEQTGKKPQARGPRGAQKPTVAGGAPAKVSSLERARQAKSGS